MNTREQKKGQNLIVKRKTAENQRFTNHFGDPLGARTQDPNIKSVVLYRLS